MRESRDVALATLGRSLLPATPERDLRHGEPHDHERDGELQVGLVVDRERVEGLGEEEVEAAGGGEGRDDARDSVARGGGRDDRQHEHHCGGARVHRVAQESEHGAHDDRQEQGAPPHQGAVGGQPVVGHDSTQHPSTWGRQCFETS